MNSVPAEQPQGKSRRGKTAIFANSKGGVGKSTLALMMSLGLATRHPNAHVELIDLDSQATSSDSLRRFANHRFAIRNDDSLFLASGSPNNGNIINHIDSEPAHNRAKKFIVFDSPAGNEPSRSSFLWHCDVIFVPTSVSDADVFATRKYLSSLKQLFERQRRAYEDTHPAIVILPNLVDSREEFNELRNTLADCQAFIGNPLYYSPLFRKAFREQDDDGNIKALLQSYGAYIKWLTNTFAQCGELGPNPEKLFQL
ncbi:MAG: ParA family protein [Pseudomonadota bacterium]|nr:ParA family protein [Pseudomonadota bacterium]